MKKVLHVLATSSFSGAENVACDIILNLSNKYRLVYCSPRGNIEKKLKNKNIEYIPIKKLNLKEIKTVIKKYNPDIIHAHDYRTAFLCSLVKKRKKLIIHLHNNSPWLKKICINSFIFLYSAIKADSILIVSDSIKNEYIFKKIISKKIICVSNPVSRTKVLKQVKKIYTLEEKRYDLCCVARITKQKNPERFIKIIQILKKDFPLIKVIWVGEGEYKEKFIKKCKELGLSDNILFLGFQDNPYKYMNESKIFLLTSDWEGYGLVAFEALSLGLPCVVSKVGGLVNIVDDSCGKLCNIDNIDNFVKEISNLLKNEKYFNSKSHAAIKKSCFLDNFASYYKKIDEVYN